MNKKTKIFLGILIVLIIILSIITFVLPKPTPPIPAVPTKTPQGDSGILENQEEIRTSEYPLLAKTPYRTTLYEITYSGPLKLKVTMFIDDQEKIRADLYSWMKQNGVAPATHQYEYVKPSLPY